MDERVVGSTKSLRSYVGEPCAYCGKLMDAPTKDHALTPKVSQGRLSKLNRVICCYPCNKDKGCLPLWAWVVDLKNAGDPRAELAESALMELLRLTR